MSAVDFMHQYGGRRLDSYDPMSFLFSPPASEDEHGETDLGFEVEPALWEAIDPNLPLSWRCDQWEGRPRRFIDGKDVGDTAAWLLAPSGEPVPVRLSQIGSTILQVEDGWMERAFAQAEPVVSFVADAFPWDDVERLGRDLNAAGMRLLAARPDGGFLSPYFEVMRKAAQNRTNEEMITLEEAALARALAEAPEVPVVVDGRLAPRVDGFDAATSPVVGVIKTHNRNYLHPRGLNLLYQLGTGQRSPVFRLLKTANGKPLRPQVVSWYLRLAGGGGALPNTGYVRVEIAWDWFKTFGADDNGTPQLSDEGRRYVDCLSRLLFEYRCADASYNRAAISLEPIVCAEQRLGALFLSPQELLARFYRLCAL